MAGTRVVKDGLEATARSFEIDETLMKTDREELAFVSGDTVKSFTLSASARVTMIVFEMPTFSGAAVTGIVSIENSDSVEIHATGAGAENAVHVSSPDPAIPLVGTNTIKVTLSTDPLSSGTCYVTMYLEG